MAFLFICISLFACKKSVPANVDWAKKRLEAKTVEEYIELGVALDTLVKSYVELKYDSIVALDYLSGGLRIAGDSTLTDTILRRQSLNLAQSNYLIETLNSKKTYEFSSIAGCFEPHMTFVFYHKDKIVAYSSVCLKCLKLISTINVPDSGFNGEKLIGQYGGNLFSKLCNQLYFSQCEYSKEVRLETE